MTRSSCSGPVSVGLGRLGLGPTSLASLSQRSPFLAGWNELLIASFSHRSISVKDGILLATGLHVHRNSAHSAGVGAIFDRWGGGRPRPQPRAGQPREARPLLRQPRDGGRTPGKGIGHASAGGPSVPRPGVPTKAGPFCSPGC